MAQIAAPFMDLRVSKVAPAVEDSLVQLVDMVKMLGRKGGDLTESQNRRMVNYLGNVDDMRQQIVIMVQRYEDDEHVLKRLLNLIDRIDDVKQLASTSNKGMEGNDSEASEKELAQQYDTPFNPLMVSRTNNLLDASGLFNDEAVAMAVMMEEAEPDGADFWDHQDDPSQIAPEEKEEVGVINLSASSVNLPSVPPPNPLTVSQLSSAQGDHDFPPPPPVAPTIHPAPPQNPPLPPRDKGKKKAASDSESEEEQGNGARRNGRGNAKGKGKGKAVARNWKAESESSSSSPESEESSSSESSSDASSSDDVGGAGSSRRRTTIVGAQRNHRWRRATRISRGGGPRPPPPPPPMPPPPRSYNKRPIATGPCDPVLCKICYDEYTRIEKLYGFTECGHKYCRECLQDYLTTSIVEGAVLDLTCPFPGCETEILPKDVQALCNAETITKYERFTVLAALRMDPNARWCPNLSCNNGIKADPKNKWVFCNLCKFEFCFHCMAERHDGFECGKEALEFLEKKKASEALAQEHFTKFTEEFKVQVKPCPTCHAYIEKNDGCNHMTCGNQACRAQFCWLCLRLYSADHFSNDIEYPECYDKQYWSPVQVNYEHPFYPPYHAPRRSRISNIAKKVGIYMGVGVAVVTLGVPAAVIGGPVYGCFQLHKRLKARRRASMLRASYNHDPNFVPPSPQRIAEAAREVERLRRLEAEAFRV